MKVTTIFRAYQRAEYRATVACRLMDFHMERGSSSRNASLELRKRSRQMDKFEHWLLSFFRQQDETLAVLRDCRRAIASLQDHELGIDPDVGYPYRDELLCNIDKVVTRGEMTYSPGRTCRCGREMRPEGKGWVCSFCGRKE